MVPVKIECDCGQHYAFDVEPVNGRMPSGVTCPTCGADGTIAANDSIARHFTATVPIQPVIKLITPAPAPIASVPPSSAPITAPSSEPVRAAAPSIHLSTRSTATAATPPRTDLRRGLVDPAQAEHEARAKAMWGDSEKDVTGYLMLQGFNYPEATELAKKIFKERAAAVRANGIRKIIIGFGLMCVPVITFIISAIIGIFIAKIIGAAVLAGLYGMYLSIMGILMAVAPKSEKGDVADQ